ncbi:DUF4234 domain-containing protein [Blastococcus brunescens]|uniref:DUF4234 domain-containing protein n=1 Tax=Blastococcus brunescens TaxID=1564165 RepID=A0ABZ1AU70_9ACTN|nr:DUF4234 domain-containing protein [Blastococcus sp. BMG 8361]WRL62127.1 DUF4234 domain-containing protein [Blastococcus sp. BMG 8361]
MTMPQNPPQNPPPPPQHPPPPPDAGRPDERAPYGYAAPPAGYGPQGYGSPAWTQQMPGVPASEQYGRPQGPVGQVRPTGMIILLFFVTLGIWGLVYYFQTHEEMKRHSGEGLGGVLALVIAFIVGLVSPFLLSNEVGQLYERRGQEKPVSALTALWFFPGLFILVGPFIWFVQTNNALNAYWQSLGQTRTTLV